eukprot:5653944-Amphidinium_carterae.2
MSALGLSLAHKSQGWLTAHRNECPGTHQSSENVSIGLQSVIKLAFMHRGAITHALDSRV